MHRLEANHSFTRQLIILFLIFMLVLFLSVDSHAGNNNNEKIVGDRVLTLWSDKEECYKDGAYIISIESKGDSYKVAACSAYGCRASVAEFGKKSHPSNYRNDSKFVWINDTIFETKINDEYKRFYQCKL